MKKHKVKKLKLDTQKILRLIPEAKLEGVFGGSQRPTTCNNTPDCPD
jgi:hypothetical protein